MAELKNFYVRDFAAWKKTLSRGKFSDKELEVKIVEHGIVLPARHIPGKPFVYEGGVCDNDFNFVAGFSRIENALGGGFLTVESSYAVDRKELISLDEDVIFGGVLSNHFGHFMVEYLCRLWYAVQNPNLKSKILFITFREPPPWFNDAFRLMGINKERIIYVDKPTQCRSVTIPAQSEYSNPIRDSMSFTKEFFLPYQAIKSRVTPGKIKKLYLTRTKFDAKNAVPYRKFFNEKYFEDFFKARGFEIVSPEELSLEEQISLIMGADEVAAGLGTLTHWAIFCKPETKFVMLNRTHEKQLFQSFVNIAFNIKNYCIVDAVKNFMYAKHDNGVFLLGSNKYWKEFVADYFGEQIDEDDDISYLEDALDKYVSFWCRKYQDPKNLNIWIQSLSGMCHRIVELERVASKNRLLLNYQTHIANKGWGTWNSEGMFSNPLDQRLDIQAIKIDFASCKVHYAVYFNETEGWSAEVAAPEMAGTTGKRKPIMGIKIRLDEAGAKDFDILYRLHTFDDTWTPWAKNGEELLSGGVKLNSLQIELKPKA